MEIKTTQDPKIVIDYEFFFDNGTLLPVVIDAEMGDTITASPEGWDVVLVARPSVTDEKVMLPATEVWINRAKVNSSQKMTRVIQPMTPEQRFDWDELMKEISEKGKPTIQ